MSVKLGNLSHSLPAAVIQTVSSSPLLTVAFPGQEVMSSSSTSRWLVEDPEWAGFNDTETIGCFTSVMCQVKVAPSLVGVGVSVGVVGTGLWPIKGYLSVPRAMERKSVFFYDLPLLPD